MNQNMLKPNPSKTEFMIIGNLTQRKKVADIFPVELLNQNFAEIDSIRNLGVPFDPAFSFKEHVSSICRSSFYHIRDLRRIRIHLNKATAISLANALVGSRLDYCNSLLFRCSAIKSRIKFKLNLLTYKALFMDTPSYLSDLLHFEKHQQTLRSESTNLSHPGPRSKRNYGHSSFVVAAPRIWNKLPLEICEAKSVTIFRRKIKTHLFTLDLPP